MTVFDNGVTRRTALGLTAGSVTVAGLAVGSVFAGQTNVAGAEPTSDAPSGRLLNREGLQLTFSDEFDTVDYNSNDPLLPLNGKWATWLNHPDRDSFYSRHLHEIDEQQYYVDPYILKKLCSDIPGYAEYNPFSLVEGPEGKFLRITARRMSRAMVIALRNRLGFAQRIKTSRATNNWSSGCLTTWRGFKQTYGLWETRVRLSSVAGSWPAFWLLPADRGSSAWPPEIDIFDNYQQRNTPSEGRANRWNIGGIIEMHKGFGPKDGNIDGRLMPYQILDNWHTIGVEWGKENLSYYADDVEIYRIPTPPNFSENMFINLNLAIVHDKNKWAIPPAPTTNKIVMDVDWVRVWKR